MRRFGVIAATLVLVTLASGCSGGRSVHGHSCTATDQDFIRTASADVTGLGMLTADYQSGQAEPKEVAQQAFDAAERVHHTDPKDPSLRAARSYLDAMFQEYGAAVTIQAKGGEAGERMYRAYGLANFAHDVLAQAQPALSQRGCDVAALL
ncbi:MAG TPA: hypothetical protein VFW80_06515 [Gaiellaceae bacterium]|nr:hypothetical protein [Gaiellaceae bacterium]